jgi:hypothetical protein
VLNIARRARPCWVPWAVTIQFSNQFCCFRFLLILVMSASGTFETCRPSVTVSAFGENRKSSTESQTDAIDPERTSANYDLRNGSRIRNTAPPLA